VLLLFFFQAEDGIRDRNVTGVQTCALPISAQRTSEMRDRRIDGNDEVERRDGRSRLGEILQQWREVDDVAAEIEQRGRIVGPRRSEERRVGKEWSCRLGQEA